MIDVISRYGPYEWIRFKVTVDPTKMVRILDEHTFTPIYDHMVWCKKNNKHHWYNESDDYSYVVFSDIDEAIAFDKVFGENNKNDEEYMWMRLQYA